MTAKVSLSRQASAVSILLDVIGGAKTKPKGSQLEMTIADGRAAEQSLIWLDNNKDVVVDAILGTTIGKAITERNDPGGNAA